MNESQVFECCTILLPNRCIIFQELHVKETFQFEHTFGAVVDADRFALSQHPLILRVIDIDHGKDAASFRGNTIGRLDRTFVHLRNHTLLEADVGEADQCQRLL